MPPRARPISSLAISALLLCALLSLPACSSFWPSPRPPSYPPAPGGPGSGSPQNPNPSPNPTPSPTLPPSASSSIIFTPIALHAQVSRALDPVSADALSAGFTFEARVDAPPNSLPFAVDPDLQVTEARDDRGRDLAGPSSEPARFPSSITSLPAGPRWAIPASRSASTLITWKRYGLDTLPRTLSRLRGYAVCYTIAESIQRDVGITSSRPPVELLPGFRITIRSVQRVESTMSIQATLERAAPLTPFAGLSIEVPRIIRAIVLDQRGTEITQIPILSASLIPPKPGDRAWPISLAFFVPTPAQRPTTLRLHLATRLDRLQIPFDYQNLPVADPR